MPGGNIPPQHPFVDIKMTFKEGGAFDFSATYDRIKERMDQTVSLARENGSTAPGMGSGGLPQADLEQLPAYTESGASPVPAQEAIQPAASTPQVPASGSETLRPSTEEPHVKPEPSQELPPTEPPPGYEETQAATVARDLEDNIRRLSS